MSNGQKPSENRSSETRSVTPRSLESIARVDRSKLEAISWYDRISPWYDTLVGRFERTARSRGIELLDVEPGERVLDIGAGTGRALVSFGEAVGTEGYATGLDISGGMCTVARRRIVSAGLDDRVAVVRGDAEHLPLVNGSFDALFVSFTLELIDTPALPIVLEECRRVLGDDGRFVVVALSKRDDGIVTSLYERIHERAPRYADCRPIFAQTLLDESGFTVVEAETVPMWGLTIEVVLGYVAA